MMAFWGALTRPAVALLIGWHVVWGGVALVTAAGPLIEFLNGILLATALMVTIAYWPGVWGALRRKVAAPGDILVLGIWLAWVSVIEQRVWSISFRMMGQPTWFLNTDYTTHFISMTLLAGLCHVAGPEAIEGRVPTAQYIRLGIIVGIGALLAMGIMWLGTERYVDLRTILFGWA